MNESLLVYAYGGLLVLLVAAAVVMRNQARRLKATDDALMRTLSDLYVERGAVDDLDRALAEKESVVAALIASRAELQEAIFSIATKVRAARLESDGFDSIEAERSTLTH